MNPEYPKHWLIEATSRSFQGTSGKWSPVPNPIDPVTTIQLHGKYLYRGTDESTLSFIHRAGEWAAEIYRKEDIVKLTDAFLGKQEADAKYYSQLSKVFPKGAWFEVKPFRGQKKPIAMQVDWHANEFSVQFKMPKKPKFGRVTRGYVRRTIPIREIGRQVAPPQENP